MVLISIQKVSIKGAQIVFNISVNSFLALSHAVRIKEQLEAIMKRYKVPIVSCEGLCLIIVVLLTVFLYWTLSVQQSILFL